uniref:RRM domain-containing protein n=1 Tax=Panagrolaimus davidi TaxID=227884 RepID=A0A914QT88_9BILA
MNHKLEEKLITLKIKNVNLFQIDHVVYAYVLFNDYNNTAVVKFNNEDAVSRAISTFDRYWLHGRRIQIEKYDDKIHFDYLVHFLDSKRTIPLKQRSKPSENELNYMRQTGQVWEVWEPQRSHSLKLISETVRQDWRGTKYGKIIGGYYAQPKKDTRN